MRKNIKDTSASITIEASIALTLFMFLVLLIYSFFVIFEAQGKVASTLLRTSESMSLDSYATDKLDLDNNLKEDVSEWIIQIGFQSACANPEFVSGKRWYENTEDANESLQKVVKERFCAYLTEEGTESSANELLEQLRVVGGYEGIDFSESKVDENGDICLVVKYELSYIFDFPLFNMENPKLKYTTRAHLWGVN